MAFALSSPVFYDGGPIPEKYARAGQNVSPPLEWHDAPRETRSFALIVEDPDAPMGTFRHWAIYDLPANISVLPEDAGRRGARFPEGVNDFGDAAYDGPQPPRGHGAHHYHFRLAALDVDHLKVPRNARVADIWRAAQPHIIDETEMVGTFER